MSHRTPHVMFRLACAAFLAGLLSACGQSAPPDVPPPDAAPIAPALPPPDAPAPAEPPPAAEPVSVAKVPALDSMNFAIASAKGSVPVELRYSFDRDPVTNQPVTLHLAAVPRVAGSNLTVSFKAVDGVQVAAAGPLNVQKASAQGAYRQQYAVTRQSSAPPELRVLVTMDLPQGSGFGFFRVPFEPGQGSRKQDSVKQH